MNIIMLGDSITKGYKPDGYTPYTLAKTIEDKTGDTVLNAGYNGAQVSVGNGSFDKIVNQYNFSLFDMVIIMYGTNDFGWQDETIDQFKSGYQRALDKIKQDSSSIKIKLVTPIHEFAFANGDLNFKNNHGVSQNMISDAIIEIAKNNDLSVFDWRKHEVVTDKSQLYPDGTHPRDETYQAMGEALAEWIAEDEDGFNEVVGDMELTHVDSPFDLSDITVKNYEKCLQALKTIYPKISQLSGDDYTFNSQKMMLKDKSLNRTLWLYIFHVFNNLKNDINRAIGIFKSNGFANLRTNDEFEEIDIVLPTSLVIDKDYQSTINGNWDKIQTALNDLLAVLKKFHMVKGDK